MDPKILGFAQVMAILVPSVLVLTGIGVCAHWLVERTNRVAQGWKHQHIDDQRLERLERAVDAIAVEMERLGEGQRFVTKLLVDRSKEALPPAPPPPPQRVITPH